MVFEQKKIIPFPPGLVMNSDGCQGRERESDHDDHEKAAMLQSKNPSASKPFDRRGEGARCQSEAASDVPVVQSPSL